jgi:hypothetical protein
MKSKAFMKRKRGKKNGGSRLGRDRTKFRRARPQASKNKPRILLLTGFPLLWVSKKREKKQRKNTEMVLIVSIKLHVLIAAYRKANYRQTKLGVQHEMLG